MHRAMMTLNLLCMLRVNVLTLTCGGDETQSQVAVNTDKIRLCGDSLNAGHNAELIGNKTLRSVEVVVGGLPHTVGPAGSAPDADPASGTAGPGW